MLLLPELYQLCGSCYGSHQNVFAAAFPMEKQLILFDTGLDAADMGIIQDNLLLWGLDSFQVSHVFLTHSHFDHTGNARSFLSNGAQLLIGAEDADAVENGSAGSISYCYGVPFPACPVTYRLADGERINIHGISVECHQVPGHTRGSMAYSFLWYGKTVLVTGDFLQTGNDIYAPVLGIRVDEGYCYEGYRESLKKMASFSCDVILPGHFQVCMKDGKRLLGAGYREILVNRGLYKD